MWYDPKEPPCIQENDALVPCSECFIWDERQYFFEVAGNLFCEECFAENFPMEYGYLESCHRMRGEA